MINKLTLNAKEQNRLSYSLDIDTTGYTVTFRMKASIENTTEPLAEVNATKLTESTTSTGYFDIDLTATDYSGEYFYEIELNGGVNPPVFFGIKPEKLKIQTRLDN